MSVATGVVPFGPTVPTLVTFLQETKTFSRKLQPNSTENILVVLGNESCDLDSVVSSIIYAYLIFVNIVQTHQHKNLKNQYNAILPVINVPRKYLPVKTESMNFLATEKIPIDSLICSDEIDLKGLGNANRLNLVLVDHHMVQEDLRKLGMQSKVVRVVDHRAKESQFNMSAEAVHMEGVGSCTTLITEEILETNPPLIKHEHVAMLLFGTIILDTKNFSENKKKFTDKDKNMLNQLKTQGNLVVKKKELFKSLKEAKKDVDRFSALERLYKDSKKFRYITVATLTTSAQVFLQLDNCEQQMQQFCELNKTPVLVLLGSGGYPDVKDDKRQIYTYYDSRKNDQNLSTEQLQNVVGKIWDTLLTHTEFGLTKEGNAYFANGILYTQNETNYGRKDILPAIERAYGLANPEE